MSIFSKELDYSQLDTSSKVNAKLSCLKICNNDVAKARELYDFVMGDLANIPEVTLPPDTMLDQAKKIASDTWGFLNNNQDQLVQLYTVYQAMKSGSTPAELLGLTAATTEIPSI
ncbi:MAG: hypothetical protein R3Y39_08560 [Rikenellaceae bacterium]